MKLMTRTNLAKSEWGGESPDPGAQGSIGRGPFSNLGTMKSVNYFQNIWKNGPLDEEYSQNIWNNTPLDEEVLAQAVMRLDRLNPKESHH